MLQFRLQATCVLISLLTCTFQSIQQKLRFILLEKMPTISSFSSQETQRRAELLDKSWGGRFLPVSCPTASVIRHPPQRVPSLPPQRLLGSAPNGCRPSRAQAVSPVFLHCVSCIPPLRFAPFRFAPRGGRSPSACTCYPCPRRRVAQGLLVNNNRQYQNAERTTR